MDREEYQNVSYDEGTGSLSCESVGSPRPFGSIDLMPVEDGPDLTEEEFCSAVKEVLQPLARGRVVRVNANPNPRHARFGYSRVPPGAYKARFKALLLACRGKVQGEALRKVLDADWHAWLKEIDRPNRCDGRPHDQKLTAVTNSEDKPAQIPDSQEVVKDSSE
jgi:hypothetical protein